MPSLAASARKLAPKCLALLFVGGSSQKECSVGRAVVMASDDKDDEGGNDNGDNNDADDDDGNDDVGDDAFNSAAPAFTNAEENLARMSSEKRVETMLLPCRW
mmetsp:Transcript_34679/g.76288  ORF Transcript_34679/g.76288 Transcript_34679/m.76288 type:complete len:103 (-) Transcript_34679:342-650(-)